MSEVTPEDRGIAAAPTPTVAELKAQIAALKVQIAQAPKGPSLASRVGRQLLRVLHDKRVDTELKILAPILVVRLVAYVGGSVEAAKLIEQGLKALGV
jgi:hypothetical protein